MPPAFFRSPVIFSRNSQESITSWAKVKTTDSCVHALRNLWDQGILSFKLKSVILCKCMHSSHNVRQKNHSTNRWVIVKPGVSWPSMLEVSIKRYKPVIGTFFCTTWAIWVVCMCVCMCCSDVECHCKQLRIKVRVCLKQALQKLAIYKRALGLRLILMNRVTQCKMHHLQCARLPLPDPCSLLQRRSKVWLNTP